MKQGVIGDFASTCRFRYFSHESLLGLNQTNCPIKEQNERKYYLLSLMKNLNGIANVIAAQYVIQDAL